MEIKKGQLRDIAYARSGDKGNNANIGVIAYTEQGFHFLKEFLTAEKVYTFLAPLGCQRAVRYELPNLWAFNFVLYEILGGGGGLSLRIDSQGKALGQVLLEMPLDISSDLLEKKETPP